jgi:hypothetical protein
MDIIPGMYWLLAHRADRLISLSGVDNDLVSAMRTLICNHTVFADIDNLTARAVDRFFGKQRIGCLMHSTADGALNNKITHM